MSSTINLENLPELVLGKITSHLDHKQLLALEQVSRKLKCAVDAHFASTNHLIIGSLPKLDTTVKDEKRRDGLLKIIKRCGIRLRTIQLTVTYDQANDFCRNPCDASCRLYFERVFASVEVSNNSPNIENIIVSPNIDLDISHSDPDVLFKKTLLLDDDNVVMYANNIKLSTGKTSKLRSIREPDIMATVEHTYQRILNLYGNLEQISLGNPDENFFELLNQFMENGLKVLEIRNISRANLRIATNYCNIWKNLRVLRLGVDVGSDDDISALNKLQFPKITQLSTRLSNNCLAHLNENICDSVIECNIISPEPTNYSLLSKFKNLERFNITNSENLQVIAQGSFPKLRRIKILHELCWTCYGGIEKCALKFFPQLLIKCNQLTHIDIPLICRQSARVIWETLRHCKAAKIIRIQRMYVLPFTITYEDVAAICHLPNLLQFRFGIMQLEEDDDTGSLHRELMERAVQQHTHLQFEYKFYSDSMESIHHYLLYRIQRRRLRDSDGSDCTLRKNSVGDVLPTKRPRL